jgi:hypothetical protein
MYYHFIQLVLTWASMIGVASTVYTYLGKWKKENKLTEYDKIVHASERLLYIYK